MPVTKFTKLQKTKASGFTLIELIAGIIALSAALLIMTGSLFPQAERTTDPWFQVRSAELAQSMMNEIMARRYDENSLQFGTLRCDDDAILSCTSVALISACNSTEEASRDLFDDVDDFACFSANGNDITNIENTALANVYAQFQIDVSVTQDTATSKLVTVTVTPPRGSAIVYSAYKVNY